MEVMLFTDIFYKSLNVTTVWTTYVNFSYQSIVCSLLHLLHYCFVFTGSMADADQVEEQGDWPDGELNLISIPSPDVENSISLSSSEFDFAVQDMANNPTIDGDLALGDLWFMEEVNAGGNTVDQDVVPGVHEM